MTDWEVLDRYLAAATSERAAAEGRLGLGDL